MLDLRTQTDYANKDSLASRFRQRRFEIFKALVADWPRPLRIIDVGGTTHFWESQGWAGDDDYQVTLINLEAEPGRYDNIQSLAGDATNLEGFADDSFDVAFSNSVIEHLFTWENQAAMAREIQRVAKGYWVQTPNYWFPLEPHYQFPAWQWLPRFARIAILRRRRCGWRGPLPDREQAARSVDEIKLLSGRQMRKLFPGCNLRAEKVYGMIKSWVAESLPAPNGAGS